jgi:hypothetical protein
MAATFRGRVTAEGSCFVAPIQGRRLLGDSEPRCLRGAGFLTGASDTSDTIAKIGTADLRTIYIGSRWHPLASFRCGQSK